MSSAPRIVWVAAEPPSETLDATVVVLPPTAHPGHFQQQLAHWERRGVQVIACVDNRIDPHSLRMWHEAGALCLVQLEGEPQSSLETRVARLARHHEPTQLLRVRTALTTLRRLELPFRTPAEAELVAELIAHALPDPMRRIAGILELMINAIEHGNLELSAPEKQELLRRGEWTRELERRLSGGPFAARRAIATLCSNDAEWVLTIEDEGPGHSPAASEVDGGPSQLRGRGIALARSSFDELWWEGRGNRVVVRIHR